MKRRAVLLILSVVVAAIGTGLIAVYVKSADDRAADDQERVYVLYSAQQIRTGTPVSSLGGSLTLQKVPRSLVAPTSLQGANASQEFTQKYASQVSRTDIPAGVPIVPQFFSAAGATEANGIPSGYVGIVLQMENAQRAIGLITPNIEVTVLLTLGGTTRTLIPRAKVLAVDGQSGDDATSSDADQKAQATVALAVKLDDSKRLTLARKAGGELYFVIPSADLKSNGDLIRGKPIGEQAL